MTTNRKEDQKANLAKQAELLKQKQAEIRLSQQTENAAQTVGYDRDEPISLLEQIQAKKRMYMDKVVELNRMENELLDSRVEERLNAIRQHYIYI